MPRLLVSVRDREEFRLCTELGVGLIDFKEPSAGALEPTSSELWSWAAEQARCDLSLALGELRNRCVTLSKARRLAQSLPQSGIRYAKFGWSQLELHEGVACWDRWKNVCTAEVETVLVAYADHQACGAPSPEALIDWGISAGVKTFLIDTFDKGLGPIWNSMSLERLVAIRQSIHKSSGHLALAGSLRLSDLEAIESVAPDIVAIRGGACAAARTGNLVGELIQEWLAKFSEGSFSASVAGSTTFQPSATGSSRKM